MAVKWLIMNHTDLILSFFNKSTSSFLLQKARTVPQYQQQSQQQSKYPREVPPRFLRQQQMKQNRTTKDSSNSDNYYDNSNNSNYRDHHHHHHHNTNGWTEIAPSNTVSSTNSNTSRNNFHHSEDWDLEIDYKPSNSTVTASDLSLNSSSNTKSHNVGVIGQPLQSTNNSSNSWGGIPASEDWDLDMRPENGGLGTTTKDQISSQSTVVDDSGTKMNSVVKNLFNSSTNGLQPHQSNVDMVSGNGNTNNDPSWGVSLTGSTWETVSTSAKQWDSASNNSKTSMNEEKPPVAPPPEQSSKIGKENLSAQPRRNGPDSAKQNSSNHSTTSSNPPPTRNVLDNSAENVRTASPGITSWAGLDSFDAGPAPSATVSYNENTSNQERPSGTKPKHSNVNNSKSNGHHSKEHLTNGSVNKALSSVNNRVDTNSKVSGWLQSTSPQTENWNTETHKSGEEDFGWTTVAKPSKVSLVVYLKGESFVGESDEIFRQVTKFSPTQSGSGGKNRNNKITG